MKPVDKHYEVCDVCGEERKAILLSWVWDIEDEQGTFTLCGGCAQKAAALLREALNK